MKSKLYIYIYIENEDLYKNILLGFIDGNRCCGIVILMIFFSSVVHLNVDPSDNPLPVYDDSKSMAPPTKKGEWDTKMLQFVFYSFFTTGRYNPRVLTRFIVFECTCVCVFCVDTYCVF